MSRNDKNVNTLMLLTRLPQQFITLAKAEFANAKAEISVKAKRGGAGAVAIVIALFFVFFALSAFVTAAIAGIATVWPVWLAALVVGFGLLLLAAAAVFGGIALIKRGIPVPEKTLSRVEGDVSAVSEVKFNQSAHLSQAGEKGEWR